MLDLKWIRENPNELDAALDRRGFVLKPEEVSEAYRGFKSPAEIILAMDSERRACITALQEMQATRNALSKEIGKVKGKAKGAPSAEADALMAEVVSLKDRTAALENKERSLSKELDGLLAGIPNLPAADVPEGKDEHANIELRKWGQPRDFGAEGFEPKQHFELGESLGLMDFEAAAKISGARFTVLKGGLARLERAIGQFMLDLQTEAHGYTEVNPPLLVKDHAAFGTAQLPKFVDDLFQTTDEAFDKALEGMWEELPDRKMVSSFREKLDQLPAGYLGDALYSHYQSQIVGLTNRYWLIPTAEVPLTNLVRESIVSEAELPYRFTALTPCFRAEAGAAGKDTRGMIRQHQFNKVEMVSITTPEQSEAEHERMTACAEAVLKKLELPYRVMVLSTGDMGFAARKTYDIEVWLPGQGAYREISSCSNCWDFQARRMNARYRPSEDKNLRFVHTLNGSGLAVGRTLIAVLENYQEGNGSIGVPDVLKPYMGGVERIG